jgi:ring-1,2-phenylacetyl-CoA epoxidase subunit PaaE
MIHFHALRVAEVRRETDDTVSIAFEVPDSLRESFAYQAGQYLTLRTTLNGEALRRSYSLCSAPHEGEWRVAVKQVADGRFSTWVNQSLQDGDTLEVMPPQGRFVLRPAAGGGRHIVLFAAGSGITPVISILKTVLEQEPTSRVTLFYGNRQLRSVIFLEALENLKNRYLDRLSLHFIFSRESQSSPLFEGRIDAGRCQELVDRFAPPAGEAEYFVCGPEEMIRDVMEALKTKGVAEERIHFELFTTPVGEMGAVLEKTHQDEKPVGSDKSRVQVRLDGRVFAFELPYNGVNILDASMVTGADLPFSCKGGVCCTCRAKLVSGEVHMDANYALEAWEVEEGFVLTCQSHPRTPEVFVDFDQQ